MRQYVSTIYLLLTACRHILAVVICNIYSNAINIVEILITVLQVRKLQEVKWLLSSHRATKWRGWIRTQVWPQCQGTRPLLNMNRFLAEKDVPKYLLITCFPRQTRVLTLVSASLYSFLLLLGPFFISCMPQCSGFVRMCVELLLCSAPRAMKGKDNFLVSEWGQSGC